MAIAALATVPKGTVIKISLTLPGSKKSFDGLALTLGSDMTAERAAAHLQQKLVRRFIDQFLPHEVDDA